MKKLKQMYGNGKTTGCPTKTFGHDRQCGFTLVELVIVIAIVIILSVVSVPIYRAYVDKSKMAEGYALIGTILSAQKAYYSEYGNFLKDKARNPRSIDEVLGIDARGNRYFTSFGFNWGTEDCKNVICIVAYKPQELIDLNPTKPQLVLECNLLSRKNKFAEGNWY